MQRKARASNNQFEMSHSKPSSMFDGVKVSKGYIRAMQQQVLNLECNQQHLISQLEHANALATEFHETAAIYRGKYDEVLHEMEILRRKHEMDTQLLSQKIEHATQDAQTERAIRQIHEEQIVLLERQIAQQVNYAAISQATTIHGNEDCSYDQYPDHEILSPVSVASPSPRALRYGQQSPRLDPETPNSGADDDDDDETEREFQMRYYRGDSSSSQTTDCSGDPICHSESDSDLD